MYFRFWRWVAHFFIKRRPTKAGPIGRFGYGQKYLLSKRGGGLGFLIPF
jgi:hypothetical protein